MSKKQVGVLARHLTRSLPDSIDTLVEEVGAEDAFVLVLLKERLAAKVDEDKDA